MTFMIAGGITSLLAFLTFWILGEGRKNPKNLNASSSAQPEIKIQQSIRLILGSIAFWQISTVAFFRFGTVMGLQGLWLGPYLMDIKGYSPVQTGNLLILLAIGAIVGGPISGQFSDRIFRNNKGVALWGLSLYTLSLLPLLGIFKIQNPLWYGQAIRITYDPGQITFDQLLDVFFDAHDPTQLNRQGNDIGTQYCSVIFCRSDDQRATARAVVDEIAAARLWPGRIVTEIAGPSEFHPAEAYHQDYFDHNPGQPYCMFVVAPKVAKFRKAFAERLKRR